MRKVIMTLTVVLAFMLNATAQERTISGRVLDDKGAPLSGVSINSSDGKTGSQTDNNGNYHITVTPAAKKLTFSSVNYEPAIVPISGSIIDVALKQANNTMEDVIITGYNRIKRADYPGAVDRVSRSAIKNTPVGSLDQQLQGRVAGLTVNSSSGQPGSPAAVTLRGLTSITGSSTPLYIVDGIPVEAGVFQSLNANDIESYDVLKDATAAALYGSRGAAGVIVITTRRGTGDKLRVTLSTQAGITQPPSSKYRMMNANELLQAQEDYGLATNAQGNLNALMFGWNTSKKNPAYIAATAAQQARQDMIRDSVSKINTNWDDVFFRQGSFVRQDITLSGGTGRTKLYSNLSYYKEDGITTRTDLKRYTWRNNMDYADNRFSMQLSSSIGYTKRNFQESTTTNNLRNPFLASRITPATVRLWKDGYENSTDYLNGLAVGTGNQFSGANLVQLNQFNKNYSDQIKVVLSNNINYKILDALTASVLFGIDYRQTQATFYSDPRVFYNTSSTDIRTKSGSMTESLDRYGEYQIRGGLTYSKTFGGKHEVEVSGFSELIKNYGKFLSATGYGIDFRRGNTWAAITQGTVQNQLVAVTGGSRTERALASQIALAKYSFNKKYTLTGSFRHDGSSQLPNENRFKNFFSVGGIWEAGREAFLKNSAFVNSLRVRASYGTAANADNYPLGNFGYERAYDIGTDGGGLPTQPLVQIGNPYADWEYTKQTNVGVDFEIWKNRLYGSIDVYNKITESTFATQQVSQTTGFTGFAANAATVSNKGIEGKLNYDVIRNRNARITLFANASYNKNRVTNLGGIGEFQSGTSLISVGKALGTHWEVAYAGIEPASGRPLYYDKYGNVTNVYSAANKVQNFGTYFAPYQGGFGTSGTFKGFDIQVFFSWQSGSKRLNNLEFFVENPASFLSSGLSQAASLNFWKGPGDVNATTQGPLYASQFSSKLIQDASFLKLKNITFGYTLPQEALAKTKVISSLRFYVTGTNIYTWTKWKGYDPEDDNNISLSEFPNPRTFTAGIDVTF